MSAVSLVCETPELAVECRRAEPSAQIVVPRSAKDGWLQSVLAEISAARLLGVALLEAPTLDDLVTLADAAQEAQSQVALAVLAQNQSTRAWYGAAADVGIYVTYDVEPMLVVLKLLKAHVFSPGQASTKHLIATDRIRLQSVLSRGSKRQGYLHSLDDGRIGYSPDSDTTALPLGTGLVVAAAISAMHEVDRDRRRVSSSVDGVDTRAVLDVLLGPARALSDPASKAALAPYGLPVPQEELCTSPSRAASEAARIGFPVRITLASPDLRVWDHPELAVDMVDSAAQVREVFRELVSLAELPKDAPSSVGATAPRVLGVTVMASGQTHASFRVVARPLRFGLVAAEIAFADPHGLATDDCTMMVLPAEVSQIERRLARLAGSSIVLSNRAAQRRANVEALADVLLRVAAFVHDRRNEVESVELRPLCLLPDGSAEVREACVTVSDIFERSLGAMLA